MTNIYYQSCVHCTIKNTCDLGHTDCDKCGDDYEPYYEPYYDDCGMFNDKYDDYYFNDII